VKELFSRVFTNSFSCSISATQGVLNIEMLLKLRTKSSNSGKKVIFRQQVTAETYFINFLISIHIHSANKPKPTAVIIGCVVAVVV
jgi:hypothetical protein